MQDDAAVKLLAELSVPSPMGHYSLQSSLIYYKQRIWVGNSTSLQQRILQALHASAIGGHSGYEATYKRMKRLFAWPRMKHDIKTFVSQCSVCQQAKSLKESLT